MRCTNFQFVKRKRFVKGEDLQDVWFCRKQILAETGTDLSDAELSFIVSKQSVETTRIKNELFVDLVNFYKELRKYYRESVKKFTDRREESRERSVKYREVNRFGLLCLAKLANGGYKPSDEEVTEDFNNFMKFQGKNRLHQVDIADLALKYGKHDAEVLTDDKEKNKTNTD